MPRLKVTIKPALATLLALAVLLADASGASAYSPGIVAGTVTDAAGPVAAARVVLIGANNNQVWTTTNSAGAYSVDAWPDTYRVGAYPPAGSSDGFASLAGVAVVEGATTPANLTLGPASTTHLSGNAFYADHAPDAGVEVSVYEERFGESGPISGSILHTDEAGNWDAGQLPSGFYRVSYSAPLAGTNLVDQPQPLGGEVIVVEGPAVTLSKELTGARPGATLTGTVVAAEGWPSRTGQLQVSQVGGSLTGTVPVSDGQFRVGGLPAGSYQLSAAGDEDEDDTDGSATVTIEAGRIGSATIQLGARSVPAGSTAHEGEYLAWLNAQRAQWGLPAGLSAVPLWSQACAAHDAYGEQNQVLEHPESPKPGHSEGGQWAGEHAVLSEGGSWSPTANPWMDAPYHLEQVLAPRLLNVGIDESPKGWGCLTTWPGMRREPAAPGTVYTFPGDGTTGLPPVEFASEWPKTPNEELGLPAKTGRQLIVWEEDGEPFFQPTTQVTAASLSSASGPVEVKWIDGYIGSIIIPVQPLAPFTRYTATVSLAPTEPFAGNVAPFPAKTYSWSFTTGKDNPGGGWDETEETATAGTRVLKVLAGYAHGHVLVRGWGFAPGAVAVHRHLSGKRRRLAGKVLATAKVGASGKFVARFRWPKAKRIAMRVFQGGKKYAVSYAPRVKHHRRHRRHRRHRHHR